MDNQQNRDVFFMQTAIEEARRSFNIGEVPVGAVIVSHGTIIARAHNLVETLHDPTAHAEMQAITSATNYLGSKYLRDCTMYVTLEPCPMCAAACYWAQIGEIIYGAEDPKRGFMRCGRVLLHPKTKLRHGILNEKCEGLLKEFFMELRKN
ncbi:MAG: nucleoside deaminase [Rikenellaceae bacterium]|nr:nucleoside deaminase [Rikenellaceae bacterium]